MTLEIHMELLRKAADTLEQRFLSPVYLVGSFEREYMNAGDIDILMVMSDERILRNFRDKNYNDRRFQFNRKQKLWVEKFVSDFDIDFKVVSQTEFESGTGTKTKLGKYVGLPE